MELSSKKPSRDCPQRRQAERVIVQEGYGFESQVSVTAGLMSMGAYKIYQLSFGQIVRRSHALYTPESHIV